jgi:hypothetical protein
MVWPSLDTAVSLQQQLVEVLAGVILLLPGVGCAVLGVPGWCSVCLACWEAVAIVAVDGAPSVYAMNLITYMQQP